MEPYQYFLAPILDIRAQVAIIALMALALLDVLFGVRKRCNRLTQKQIKLFKPIHHLLLLK